MNARSCALSLHKSRDPSWTYFRGLDTPQDVKLVSEEGKTTLASTTIRHPVGENFTETLDRIEIKGGQSVLVQGQTGLDLKAVTTHSGTGGTLLIAKEGPLMDTAVATASYRADHQYSKKSFTITKTTDIHQNSSVHGSEAEVLASSNHLVLQEGTTMVNGRIEAPHIIQEDVYDHHFVERQTVSHKKKKGLGGFVGMKERKTTTSTATQKKSMGCHTAGRSFAAFATSHYSAVNPTFGADRNEITAPIVEIKAGVNHSQSFEQSFSKDLIWNKHRVTEEDHVIHSNPTFKGETFIHSPEVTVERVRGTNPFAHLHSDSPVLFWDVRDRHHSVRKTQTSLTPEAVALVSLAVTIATSGAGSFISASLTPLMAIGAETAGAAIGAGFSAFASQAAVAVLGNKGNLFAVMDALGNPQTFKSVGLAAITGGATFGIGSGFNVDPKGLTSIAIQSGVSTTERVLTGEQNVGQSFLQGTINAVATAGAAKLANNIGELYHPAPSQAGGTLILRDPEISWTTHKFLHAGLGFGLGAASNYKNPLSGGIGGAIGAVSAEIIAESTLPFWVDGTKDELQAKTALRRAGNTGKLGGALFAFATGQDVNSASLAAVTAIENNFGLNPTPYWCAEQKIQENADLVREAWTTDIEDVLTYKQGRVDSSTKQENDLQKLLKSPGLSFKAKQMLLSDIEFAQERIQFAEMIPTTPLGLGIEGIGLATTAVPVFKGGYQVGKSIVRTGIQAGKTTSQAFAKRFPYSIRLNNEGIGGVVKGFENHNLLPAPKMARHHIFNKFRGQSEKSQKYRKFFKNHAIDVDLYSIDITDFVHRKTIHTENNNWTTRWRRWIDANPEASTKDVYQFAGKLMDEYNISHVPIKKYK